MLRQLLAILLSVILLLCAISCGQSTSSDKGSNNQQNEESNKNDSVSSEQKPDDGTTDQETTYDPDSWVNPGSLTSPYAIVNAAAKASPSVVAITTESVTYGGYYGNYVSEGAGSGVIYSEDGYVITNNHVIEGADSVRVTLVNGDTYDAEVIGADPMTDIAVVKIKATGLCAASSNLESLVVGQPVIAIGNPMGRLSGTVTSGIVSALSRWISVEGVAMQLLQFDAAASPGNSGGGLFDINGNLIAIVNSKSSGEGIEGISYAIPVQRALDITEQFIEKGYISGRPGLGVSTDCITATNYESFKDTELWNYAVSGSRIYPGVYITGTANVVYAESSNTLSYGDRITKIGSVEITDESDLIAALSTFSIGDTVTVTIARLTTGSSYFGSSSTYKSYEITLKLVEYHPDHDIDSTEEDTNGTEDGNEDLDGSITI